MFQSELNTGKRRYRSLLNEDLWYQCRKKILRRDGYACRNCGSSEQLQVHHIQYHVYVDTGLWKDPWDYDDKLLVTLCRKCHKLGHLQHKVPVFSTGKLKPCKKVAGLIRNLHYTSNHI